MKALITTFVALLLTSCSSNQKIRLTEAQITFQRDSIACSAALKGGGIEVEFPLPTVVCQFLPIGTTVLNLQRPLPEQPTTGNPSH